MGKAWTPKTKIAIEYAFKIKAMYDVDPSFDRILFISRSEGITIQTIYRYLKFAGVEFLPFAKRDKRGRFSSA